jgi:hypothetical protein
MEQYFIQLSYVPADRWEHVVRQVIRTEERFPSLHLLLEMSPKPEQDEESPEDRWFRTWKRRADQGLPCPRSYWDMVEHREGKHRKWNGDHLKTGIKKLADHITPTSRLFREIVAYMQPWMARNVGLIHYAGQAPKDTTPPMLDRDAMRGHPEDVAALDARIAMLQEQAMTLTAEEIPF